jgi:hypothetical protein
MRTHLSLAFVFLLQLLQIGASRAQDDVAVPATSSQATTTASATASSSQPVAASPLQKARLDLATPDVPAFTALNVSPTKISTPTNVKDFVAALASGINANGQVQSGVAIEVSPFQLLDNALSRTISRNSDFLQKYLGGLALSAATNSVVSGTASNMQVALGAHTGERDQSDRSIMISRSEATLAGCIRDITRSACLCQGAVWKDL